MKSEKSTVTAFWVSLIIDKITVKLKEICKYYFKKKEKHQRDNNKL